jgi:hypothetical protein
MRENDEFIGQVEDFLVEFDGDTPLPGRVIDAIHAELPQTRQAKASPDFMRMPPMLSTISSRAPLGIAAAAVFVAVILGALFISRGSDQAGVGAGPVVSPTPQASQSTGPTARPEDPMLQNATAASCPGITDQLLCLEPGTYQLGSTALWPAIVTFDVPENWWYYENGTGSAGVLVQTEDIENGSGWGVIFSTVGAVSRDPCQRSAGTFAPDEVNTASALAAAMTAWPGFEATEPAPISDLAYPGVAITLVSAPRHEDCPDNNLFTTANSFPIDGYPMVNTQGRRHETEFRIFETEGGLLVVMATNFPETSPYEEDNGVSFDPERHVDHQVQMDAILDSIRLTSPDGGAS